MRQRSRAGIDWQPLPWAVRVLPAVTCWGRPRGAGNRLRRTRGIAASCPPARCPRGRLDQRRSQSFVPAHPHSPRIPPPRAPNMAARGGQPADKERADALARMDLRKIVRAYVQQMVDEVPGYKALLLDKDTMRIVSTLFGRTELGEHSVFHIERIDRAESKDHMELKVRLPAQRPQTAKRGPSHGLTLSRCRSRRGLHPRAGLAGIVRLVCCRAAASGPCTRAPQAPAPSPHPARRPSASCAPPAKM